MEGLDDIDKSLNKAANIQEMYSIVVIARENSNVGNY